LKELLLLNADLLDTLPINESVISKYPEFFSSSSTTAEFPQTLFGLAVAGFKNYLKAWSVFHTVITELGEQTRYPVVYAVDEHNEFWKMKIENDIFIQNFWVSLSPFAKGVRFLFVCFVCFFVFLFVYLFILHFGRYQFIKMNYFSETNGFNDSGISKFKI
jgi:hypothetical protein